MGKIDINDLAYIVLGGIPYEEILVNALGMLINKKQKDVFLVRDYQKIQRLYASEYNVTLPINIIEGTIVRHFIDKNGKYELNDGSRTLKDLEEDNCRKKEDFKKKYNDLRNKFQFFYKNNNIANISGDFESLFNYIVSAKDTKLDDGYEYTDEKNGDKTKEIIKRRFCKDLALRKDSALDVVESITIANSMVKVKSFSEPYSGCVFFFDTPVVLKYLGYDGKEYQDIYNNIIDELKKSEVTFNILNHSVDECKGILYALNSAYERGNLSAKGLDLWLKAKKKLRGNVDEYIPLDGSKFDAILKRKNIEIVDSPELNSNNVVYDELKIEKLIQSNYGEYASSWPDRIRKDSKSICTVQAIRCNAGIKDPDTVVRAKFFLLTDNRRYEKLSQNNYKKTHKGHQSLSEVLHVDHVIYDLWESGSKKVLPGELFKAFCLNYDVITDEFRDEFNKLVNRLERFDDIHDINKILENNPETIDEICIEYEKSNHSFEGVEKILNQKINRENKSSELNEGMKLSEKTDISLLNINKLIEEKDAEITRLKQELEEERNNRSINLMRKIINSMVKFLSKLLTKFRNEL